MLASPTNALAAVRELMAQRRFAEACAVLCDARDAAKAEKNLYDELFLTSMLASHLSIAGEAEEALHEIKAAERLDPGNGEIAMRTVRQLIRMRRYADAASRCRQLIAEDGLQAAERHEAVASLGESLSAQGADGSSQLLEALRIARASDLEPMYWNRTFALRLARQSDRTGIEYLEALRDAAMHSGDESIVAEVQGYLDELRE